MRRILSFHPRDTLALVDGVEYEHIGAVQFPNKLGVREEHLDDDDVLQAGLPPPPPLFTPHTQLQFLGPSHPRIFWQICAQ